MSSHEPPPPSPEEIGEKLLRQRVVPLLSAIDDEVAEMVIAHLLFLEKQAPGAPSTLYIDSPGGVVPAALAIHDVLRGLSGPVATLALHSCSGMAVLLLAHGAPGMRSCLEDTQIILVPFHGGDDIDKETAAAEILQIEELCIRLLQADTALSPGELEEAFLYGRTFTAQEALAAGIVDRIIRRP